MFRRVLSLILSLCIMLTSMPALSVYALAEGEEEAIVEVAAEEAKETEEEPEPTEEPTPEPTEEPVIEEPVIEEPVVEEPVVEEPVIEEPVIEEPVVEEPVVEEPVIEEPVVEEPVVEEPVIEEPVVEEPVVEEPVIEEPVEEEAEKKEIKHLGEDESFEKGYVRFLKEARVYLDDEGDDYALDAAKGSVAYALSRPNAGEETDRLKVEMSIDGDVFEGYVAAEKLFPMSDADVLEILAELDGKDAVYADGDKDLLLPAVKYTLKPVEVEDDEAEEITIMTPEETEPEQEEAPAEEETDGLPAGGMVTLIPEAPEDEAEEEEEAEEPVEKKEEEKTETPDDQDSFIIGEDQAEEEEETVVIEQIDGPITEGIVPMLPDGVQQGGAAPEIGGSQIDAPTKEEIALDFTEDPLPIDIDADLTEEQMSKAILIDKRYAAEDVTGFESAHPYGSRQDYRWHVDMSDVADGYVASVALYFDTNTYFEKNKDYLVIYDYRGKVVKKYTGDELAGKQVFVPGNRFYVGYVSNSSKNYWGFRINRISVYYETAFRFYGTNDKGKPTLGWHEVFPKQGYEVWRAQYSTSTGNLIEDYKKIKSGTDKFEYTDTSAKSGCAYSYLIRVYSTVGNVKFYTYAVEQSMFALKAPTVTSTSVRKNSSGKYYVDIKWKAVPGAKEYYVLRFRDPDDNAYDKQFKVTGGTSFTDNTITSEGTYIYQIVSAGTVGSSVAFGGRTEDLYGLCTTASIITDSSSADASYIDNKGYVTLNWKDNDYAPGMKIERAKVDIKTGKVGSYSKVAEIDSGTTYTDKKAAAGGYYAYRLSNYAKNGKNKYYSVPSINYVAVPASTTISGTGAVADASVPTINLKWKAAKNASYYRLYRAEMGSTSFTLVKNVYGTSCTDYPKDYKMYQYAIQPVVMFDDKSVAAPWSPVKVYGYPDAPTGLAASSVTGKKVTLEWNPVEGATGYYIYRNDTLYGTYKRIGVSKTPKYTDSKAMVGKQNYYLVTSYVKVGSKTIESESVSTVSIYPMPAPKVTAAKYSNTSVLLSWDAVDYAAGYEVYYSTAENGPFTRAGTTNKLAAQINNIDPNAEYLYTYVRAYRKDGSVYSYSEESPVKAVLMNKINYRAIVIGQNDYIDNELQGPENDSLAMAKMLGTMSKTKYSVTRVDNLTKQGIVKQIDKVFSLADSNDVTLFYYSGHGASDGSLCGVDDHTISPNDLRQILDQYIGKKVVIIDACYSGNMIGKSVDDFNDSFVSAFSKKTKANLAAQNYYVMTACSKAQLSSESMLGSKKRVGVFTSALLYGCGWNQTGSKKISTLYADKNSDKAITLNEAYTYTLDRVDYLGDLNKMGGFDQDAKVYPANSAQKLFSR